MLLDNHPPGPLDGLWAGVAAGGGMLALADPWNSADGASASGPASAPHARSNDLAGTGSRALLALMALAAWAWRVRLDRPLRAACLAGRG